MATINNTANAASVGISSTINKASPTTSPTQTPQNAASSNATQNAVAGQNAPSQSPLKSSATDILRRNLGLAPSVKTTQAPILQSDELNLRLQSLVNKLLGELISSGKLSPNTLKEGARLNFAPNFSAELKNLLSELQKNELFKEVAQKIQNALNSANALTPELLREGLKNSGLFFEARLKGLLDPQSLPYSFHRLLGAIKSLDNKLLQGEIFVLADKQMNPDESLRALKDILQGQKTLQSLENTPFASAFKLLKNLENTAKHIAKNPLLMQNTIKSLAKHTLSGIEQLLPSLQKALAKPELLATNAPLKEFGESLKNLILILKSLANNGKIEPSLMQNPAKSTNTKSLAKPDFTGDLNDGIFKKQNDGGAKFVEIDENLPKNSQNLQNSEKNSQEMPKNSRNLGENQKAETKNSQNLQEKSENLQAKNENLQKLANAQQNTLLEMQTPTNPQMPNKIKNLIFLNKGTQLFDLEKLSQALANTVLKLKESLKSIDNKAFEATKNLQEINFLERALSQAQKDLGKIAQKNELAEFEGLKNDIKSTLLQTATLAKSANEDAVANQANRMLAQIEFSQLLSLANDDISTHLPFFWEDLKDSKLAFKGGKQGKYYARINLHFSKLGEIDILLALTSDKYLDINIMAENEAFRRLIYEHSHELRGALSKAGLINSHFFVGDIVRNRHFDAPNFDRNYDFEMGIDKHA